MRDRVLLLFSGGRDSFLSACCLIESGYRVDMVTYNNGCIANIENAERMAERIIQKYGSENAAFVGIQPVTTSLYRFQESYLYESIQKSSEKYPALRPAQLSCLACHTGMYLEAIAYCKVNEIYYIAEGARESQGFIVELPEMIERYQRLVAQNGISLILPVYHTEDDREIKLMLTERGFVPKVSEMQCWIGFPLKKKLTNEEIDSLVMYYDKEIEPRLQGLIEEKERIYSGGGSLWHGMPWQ